MDQYSRKSKIQRHPYYNNNQRLQRVLQYKKRKAKQISQLGYLKILIRISRSKLYDRNDLSNMEWLFKELGMNLLWLQKLTLIIFKALMYRQNFSFQIRRQDFN
ncbi:unnamed protein product [Paramecium octaurelia]|uniref:Uncharacterized protein n=1 Tax=Paramecium octaurelia TaxID=43137 RepID=A0A8S1YAC3_PAROT|nr:unnamed protein product [Paramecium octaurelia]